MASKTGDDVFAREQAEKLLFPAPSLPGGGQLEVRMQISPDHPDPDIRGVARRVKPFNLDSWHKEWTDVAKKNEDLAAAFAEEKRHQTAHEFYLRAADFYRRAVVYMPEHHPRMLPTFKKLEENFDKAWSLVKPPFERVEIPYEGRKLPALFWPGRGASGTRRAVVFNYGGADGILWRGEDGGAGQYVRRGMSFIDVDGPGHGGTLRHHKLYAPPDSERVATAVVDYLVTRADVFQCVGLFERAAFVVGDDVELMHLAAAAGAPCITFLSALNPERTSPRGKGGVVALTAADISLLPVEQVERQLRNCGVFRHAQSA